MKQYLVQFVVQAESVPDALSQAERYLNTGTRCVDCDVVAMIDNKPYPTPAPRLGDALQKQS